MTGGDGEVFAGSAEDLIAVRGREQVKKSRVPDPSERFLRGGYDDEGRWVPGPDFAPATGDDGQPLLTESGDFDQSHLPIHVRRYDWTSIRRRYVEGVKRDDDSFLWPTLAEVADHFGAAHNRVRERSASEGWTAQRAQWQAQVEARRREARANALVAKAVNLDTKAMSAAEAGIQLCSVRLQEIGAAAQAARSQGGPGAASSGAIDALEMTRIAQAVDLFHRIGLRAVGDPETQRIELTGANGAPLEISAELRRDDPNRIATVLGVLDAAGLGELFGRSGGLAAARGGAVAGLPTATETRR